MQTEQTKKRLAEGKQLGGRPTKYNDEVIRRTAEYLENYGDYGDLIPSVAGLSQVLNVTRERLVIWAKDRNKGEFNRIVSQLRNAQERALITGGLNASFNPGIAKLLLTKHGYHDKPESSQGDTGITVNVNRGGVTVQAGGQSVTVSAETDSPGVTLEHDPGE